MNSSTTVQPSANTTIAKVVGCDGSYSSTYNVSLHIGMVFLLVGVSCLGSLLPILLYNRLTKVLLQFGKMISAGVLLGLSWVHLFISGDQMLRDPCLSSVYSGKYRSWAGLLALLAVLGTQLIQFTFELYYRSSVTRRFEKSEKSNEIQNNVPGSPLTYTSPTSSAPSTVVHVDDKGEPVTKSPFPEGGTASPKTIEQSDELLPPLIKKERQIGVYTFLTGITLHSFMISLTLGLARSPEFEILIVPVLIYLFCEGFVLVTAVEEAGFENYQVKWSAAMYFTLVSPVGMILGVTIGSGASTGSDYALMTQGVLNSLSAGLLTYDVFTHMLIPYFSSPMLRSHTLVYQYIQILFMWLGVMLICLIGGWKS